MFWYKKYRQTPLLNIAPQQCVFHMQDYWSKSFQDVIATSVKEWYSSTSNINFVIEQMAQTYPEVGAVQAQICSADKICFFLEGHDLSFVLNNQDVVNNSGVISPSCSFAPETIQDLPHVFSSGDYDLLEIIRFVRSVSSCVAKSHDLYWHSATEVAIRPREKGNMQCLTRVGVGMSDDAMLQCCKLHEQQIAIAPKKKLKQTLLWEYDIRFKNQIILRTGG